MKRAIATLFFVAASAAAQTDDMVLLRNISGTAANPGPAPHHARYSIGPTWTTFYDGSLFATWVTQTGPKELRNEVFSTNWITFGAHRHAGNRGEILFRIRGSLEPLTVPEEGYPQLLQEISAESGGPVVDSMRAHELIGEAALHMSWRAGANSYLHLYAAPIGDPPVGPVPFAQRTSSREFAEAPFAYDVQEQFHLGTRVVTAGFRGSFLSLEGGIFHHSVTTGRHTSIDDGDIDSWAGRATITPTRNLSLQVSRADLTDAGRKVDSASLSYAGARVAFSAIWTRRDSAASLEPLTSVGGELLLRISRRNHFMLRAENVDRVLLAQRLAERGPATHFTVGFLHDFIASSYRAGIGFNFDYRTQTHDIEDIYGHKPQSFYFFARFRPN